MSGGVCLSGLIMMQSLVDTVLFHFDALTGQDVTKTSTIGEPFEGFDIIAGPIIDCFVLQNKTKTVLLLDEFMQVNTFLASGILMHFDGVNLMIYRSVYTLIPQRTKPTF